MKEYSPEQRALFHRISRVVKGQLQTLFKDHPLYVTPPNHQNVINGLVKRVANDLVSGHNLAFIQKQVIMMAKKEYDQKQSKKKN